MNSMFEIINDREVRLMGRMYLYEGEKLFYVQDGKASAPVQNPVVLEQFKNLRQDSWMDTILDMVSDRRDVVMDRWEYVIRNVLKQFPDGFHLQQLIYPVCLHLGSTEDEAIAGISYHPYTGKLIKTVQGWIATWIEERSPDSRQRYFCAGKRWIPRNRPLLFVNDGLYEANTRKEWRPYSYVRGTIWRLDQDAAEARIQPSEDVLNTAALLYRKHGMRGAANRSVVSKDVAGTERVPNLTGIAAGFMLSLGIAAAIAPNS